MIEYTNQMQTTDLDIEIHRSHHKKKNGKSPITKYCNSIMTFDIEVSSAWLENGKVIPYRKGESADYWNNLQPLALCYIWQFSCDGVVYYGRELRDFLKVLDDLPSDVEIIIWVHNLSYEFHFLTNILTWDSVFARSSHKPIKAKSKEYPNIEFRCTYMLTRLSLATWGEQLGVAKMVGDLDYDKLRTPLTKLTDKELKYCEMDCLVVEAGIKSYLKKYKKQRFIPMTQTGTVRQEVKEILMSDEEYVKKIKRLVPKSPEEYKRLQTVFAGGYTHANRYWSGQTIEGHIEHYDFASSYPTVMVAEKYPMTPWLYLGSEMPSEDSFEDYAYILILKFSQLKSIALNTYIQASKVNAKNMKLDNGRVISADELTITITEQDYITIKNNYEWENLEVIKVYRSKKDYLPKPFVEYILELYANKTELKDVEGKEELYMQSKQYINSMFGMCVTAIVQAEVELVGDEWIVKPLTRDFVQHKLEQLSQSNPREKRYFLSYSWGCWVTAYARRNLWKCIESCDHDVLYCDTDSIFVLGKHDFSWYNDEITKKLKIACKKQNLDFNKTRPKTPKGKEKPLGIFDSEDSCTEFKTLGAKRYVERREGDGKLHLTVSGINKGAVELLNDYIDNFEDGFNFDKDADCVTKKLSTYILDMPTVKWNDGYISTYTHGINLRRTGYVLSMTDEYKKLISYMDFNLNDVPENFEILMRARFS